MAPYQVELRFMHGINHDVQVKLPVRHGVAIHTILKPTAHGQLIRNEDGDIVEADEDVLGFLLTGGPVVQFLPSVKNVAIEDVVPNKPESQKQYGETKMLANTQGTTTFRRLRDGNVIIFHDADELKIRVQIANIAVSLGTLAHEHSESIQVKSSIPELEQSPSKQVAGNHHPIALHREGNDLASDAETDSESESDLDKAVSSIATPAVKAAEVTPPTSLRPEAGTVKDTPARPDSHGSNEPFSTAPLGPGGGAIGAQGEATSHLGGATMFDSCSPSARAAESQERRQQKEGKAQSGVLQCQTAPDSIIQESAPLPVEDEDIADDSIFASGSTGKRRAQAKAYGRSSSHRHGKTLEIAESPALRQARPGPSNPSRVVHNSDDPSHADEQDNSDAEDGASIMGEPDQISTALDNIDVATFRSHSEQTSQSSKRRLSEIVVEEQPTSGTKRRKAASSAATIVEDLGGSDVGEEDDALPSGNSKQSRAEARNRLLRSTAKDADDASPAASAASSFEEGTNSSAGARATNSVDKSTAPRSSPQVRIRRQRTSETPNPSGSPAFTGKAPLVLLSKSSGQHNSTTTKWLKKQGVKVIEDVPEQDSDFICVISNGPLLKTGKLLRTIAIGKPVLTDQWLIDSKQAGHLLEMDGYHHHDLLETANHDRSGLFVDKTLFFTNKLVTWYGSEGWKNIQLLCQDAGADAIVKGAASKAATLHKTTANMIRFGHDVGDQDVEPIIKDGHVIFNKDFLTHVIISGTLALDDEEFRLHVGKAEGARKGKKK